MALRPKLDQETLMVSKTVLSYEDHSAISWSTSDVYYEVLIDKKEFSSGLMKNAYKVSLFHIFEYMQTYSLLNPY